MNRKTTLLGVLLLCLMAVPFIQYILALDEINAKKDRDSLSANIKIIATALNLYADDHQANFPNQPTLDCLRTLERGHYLKLRKNDRVDGLAEQFVYFPGKNRKGNELVPILWQRENKKATKIQYLLFSNGKYLRLASMDNQGSPIWFDEKGQEENAANKQEAQWLKKYDLNGNGKLDLEEQARAEADAKAGIQAPARDE